jgi:hypothetical protein
MFKFLLDQPHRLLLLTCASIFLILGLAAGTAAWMTGDDLDTTHLARLAAEAAQEPIATGSVAPAERASTPSE